MLLALSAPLAAFATPTMTVAGHYIIQRKPSTARATQDAGVRAYSVKKQGRAIEVVVARSHARVANSSDRKLEPLNWLKVRSECQEILLDKTIESCEPDLIRYPLIVPNDTNFSSQWALRDVVNGGDIGAISAWDVATGSTAILVGVVDSGIYRTHPDLSANIWTNPNDPSDGVDNDGNGYVDDVIGIQSTTNSGWFTDCNGHGTHVSGIIAARGNNATGVSGVNWAASIVTVNTEEVDPQNACSGAAALSSIVEGFDYLTDLKKRGHNVRVVNASFGGAEFASSEKRAIERLNAADILLVAAAGNSGQNIDSVPSYPASYDVANIIAVGATGPTRQKAFYSSFGQTVDIMAPGGDSSFEGGRILSTYSEDGPLGVLYANLQGTSMATPMVTGAIALLASYKPQLTGAQLKSMVLSSATRVSGLQAFAAEGRFLNVAQLLRESDPADGCPSDPNKSSPGLCGCGVPDSSVDSDFDGTIDCQDGCPADVAKISAGACGCGVAESASDSDGDGIVNCLDGCPGDPSKQSAGACGCGVSDVDANGNGTEDCLDGRFTDTTPGKPKVRLDKRRLLISMSASPEAEYVIEVATSRARAGSRKRITKTAFYLSQSANAAVRRPIAGSDVRVRYAVRAIGSSSDISQFSTAARIRVR